MPIAICRRCARAYVTDNVAGDWRCPVCARPLVEGTREDVRRLIGRSGAEEGAAPPAEEPQEPRAET